MPVLNNEIQVDQCISTGQQVYEVLVNNWGNTGTGADATSLQFPASTVAALPSMYAIAVGARSHLNRCEVLYCPQIRGAPNEGVAEFNRSLDLGAPVIFPSAAGPVTGGQTAIRLVPRIAAGDNSGEREFLYGDSYIKEDGTSAAFGGALSAAVFKRPVLHAYLFVQSPTLGPPTRRAILTQQNSVVATAGEQLIVVVTISGRSQVRVKFRATGTLTATGRVSVIQHAKGLSSQETTVANVAGIAAATSGNANIIAPGADFMLVYFTLTGGAGSMSAVVTCLDT